MEMMNIKLDLPLYQTIERKTKKDKNIFVAMNWLRNAHHQESNNIKKIYHEIIAQKLIGEPRRHSTSKIGIKYQMRYKLYYKNTQSDLMNSVAVIDKFLQDALQELGIVSNDNVKHCVGCIAEVGGQDKDNPRLECEVMFCE